MSQILQQVRNLIAARQVRVSDHGYDAMVDDDLFVDEILAGVADGAPVEEYPNYHKGPCILVLQRDRNSQPIHVLWGVPADATPQAVLVPAYRPDAARWTDDFMRRRK